MTDSDKATNLLKVGLDMEVWKLDDRSRHDRCTVGIDPI
jgi:hypothetical protein